MSGDGFYFDIEGSGEDIQATTLENCTRMDLLDQYVFQNVVNGVETGDGLLLTVVSILFLILSALIYVLAVGSWCYWGGWGKCKKCIIDILKSKDKPVHYDCLHQMELGKM